METFAFPYHTIQVRYPESSSKVQFGRGYEFASKPKGPDQVEYVLHFAGMWFKESAPGTLDEDWEPAINMALLEAFYEEHKLYEPFIYPHPTKGNLTVRFAAPLEYKITEDGKGQVDPFTLRLKLQP